MRRGGVSDATTTDRFSRCARFVERDIITPEKAIISALYISHFSCYFAIERRHIIMPTHIHDASYCRAAASSLSQDEPRRACGARLPLRHDIRSRQQMMMILKRRQGRAAHLPYYHFFSLLSFSPLSNGIRSSGHAYSYHTPCFSKQLACIPPHVDCR